MFLFIFQNVPLYVFLILWFSVISQIVDNPAEVADKADRIITMLPSSPNVIDVYTGSNGILKYAFSPPLWYLHDNNMFLY